MSTAADLNFLRGQHLRLYAKDQATLTPFPAELADALEEATVVTGDERPSEVVLKFRSGRPQALTGDFPLLRAPQLKPGQRVILAVTESTRAAVLFDGYLVLQEFQSDPGGSGFLTLKGENIARKLDLEQVKKQWPKQTVFDIADSILNKNEYVGLGLKAGSEKHPNATAPDPDDFVRNQTDTDLRFLLDLAKGRGCVFYITPSDKAGENIAYFGPPG